MFTGCGTRWEIYMRLRTCREIRIISEQADSKPYNGNADRIRRSAGCCAIFETFVA